mgnify:CR=1 FL=1
MKLVYGIVGVVAAIAAVVIGILGMPEVMLVSALLAFILILAANADRISRLKASATGFEAETRAIIDQARATLDELRIVLKIAVQGNLMLVMRAGRWGGFSVDEKEKIHIASLAALNQLGVPKAEQEAMFHDWHIVNRFDYVHLLLGRSTIPKEIQENNELISEWKKLREGGFENISSPDVVEEFLRKSGMLNSEIMELLADYRFYETGRQHRRPDVWKRLHDRER